MTDQELFDKVARHLLKQNTKSVSYDGETCVYRGSGGLKCAIGALIPDDLYDESMEGTSVRHAEIRHAAGISTNQYVLAADLQRTHDECEPCMWPYKLRNIAVAYSLSCEVIDEASNPA